MTLKSSRHGKRVNLQRTGEVDMSEREELSNEYAKDSAVLSPQRKNKTEVQMMENSFRRPYAGRSSERDSGIPTSVSVLVSLLCF